MKCENTFIGVDAAHVTFVNDVIEIAKAIVCSSCVSSLLWLDLFIIKMQVTLERRERVVSPSWWQPHAMT